MIIVDLCLTVGHYHVMVSIGCLGLLGEVNAILICVIFTVVKKVQKVNMCEQRINCANKVKHTKFNAIEYITSQKEF